MLTPASRVTVGRGVLAFSVAVLVVAGAPAAPIVIIAAIALPLDLVDGRLARRTGTVTALGARLDGEVDAFLILALSVFVARDLGAWVLAIGAARYLFLAGEALVPWMRSPIPPRRWRKLVAAAQGIVLTVAAAGVVPRTPMQIALGIALLALAASMGECVWWLWRRRTEAGPSVAGTVVALLVVWGALVVPNHPRLLDARGIAQVPLELLVVIALVVLLPRTPRGVLIAVAGALLGVLLLVKVLDLGFYTAFDRQFDVIYDWGYAGIGVETLGDAIGPARADLVAVLVVASAAAFLVLPVLALRRVARVASERRARVLSGTAALALVWVALRALGAPEASTATSALAVREVHNVEASLRDHDVLARAIARDRFRATPGRRLLTALRGKDVLLLFVESYGQVAVQDSSFSPGVDAALDRGSAELHASGYAARSAFLTSPTFGGISWLAHSTLQSGVWINSRRRYDQVVRSRRFTLSRAFARAGWRTVAEDPQNKRDWRVGRTFYRYRKVYDRRNIGYRGPLFGLPSMPDQFVLAALQRHELAVRSRRPLFAEVDLVSSHTPWTRIPRMVPWNRLGDGAIFNGQPPAADATRDGARVAYGRSIQYTMGAIVSFVRRYGSRKLVVIALGDHQPNTTVSGFTATHNVPISIIARDPAVMRRVAGWGWQDGLRPHPAAPVWRMDAFRDRFLGAFSG